MRAYVNSIVFYFKMESESDNVILSYVLKDTETYKY